MIQSATTQPDFGFDRMFRFDSVVSKQGTADSTSGKSSTRSDELTPEEQQQIQQLKQTDRKVRAHEQAHLAVGGDLVRGGPSYTYQVGPDKLRYAVAGEVSIDTSPASTPEKTIPKARHIRETALAPAEPSAQDRSVAAQASRLESRARVELDAQKRADAGTRPGLNAAQTDIRSYRAGGQVESESSRLGMQLDIFA